MGAPPMRLLCYVLSKLRCVAVCPASVICRCCMLTRRWWSLIEAGVVPAGGPPGNVAATPLRGDVLGRGGAPATPAHEQVGGDGGDGVGGDVLGTGAHGCGPVGPTSPGRFVSASLDDFEMLEKLGRGNCGTVYRVSPPHPKPPTLPANRTGWSAGSTESGRPAVRDQADRHRGPASRGAAAGHRRGASAGGAGQPLHHPVLRLLHRP